MPVDRYHDRNAGHQDDPGQQRPRGRARRQAAELEELYACLSRDHAINREPADREEEGEGGAHVGPAPPEDAPGEHDLGEAGARTGVAQQPEDHRPGGGAKRDRGEAVPHAQAVVGREQAGREEAGVVDEGARPQERQLTRAAVALTRRDGIDAARLHLEERVTPALAGIDARRLGRHMHPSAGITQFRFMRSATTRPLSPSGAPALTPKATPQPSATPSLSPFASR